MYCVITQQKYQEHDNLKYEIIKKNQFIKIFMIYIYIYILRFKYNLKIKINKPFIKSI